MSQPIDHEDHEDVESSGLVRPQHHEREGWSMLGTLAAARRMIAKAAAHTRAGRGGLDELEALVELRKAVEGVIDEIALHLLEAEETSYAEIGKRLGLTKQRAQQRYRGASKRRRGGQRAGTR